MRTGGIAARSELLRLMTRASLDDKIRRGELTAVFPRTYARPWDVELPEVRRRAALLSVGGDAALSHLSALERLSLPTLADSPIHVTAYNPRHPRGVPGELVVHRTLLPLDAIELDGLPVVCAETALVTSWPLLSGPDQRAPIIEAARRRLLTPSRLLDRAEKMWWVSQIRSLRELVALLAAGCESELELWGYTDVFNVPGLDDATRQLRVRVGDALYRLDMAYEQERLVVELDGRAYHSSREQTERDMRRDTALATIGWQTLRFSHLRLHNDIPGCRRDALAVRAARRRMLA